jgi:hypothetical protein
VPFGRMSTVLRPNWLSQMRSDIRRTDKKGQKLSISVGAQDGRLQRTL